MIEKLLQENQNPYSIEAEQNILGLILNDNNYLDLSIQNDTKKIVLFFS